MALTANREVDHYVDQELRTVKVAAAAHIYKGALVGLTGGYARGLVAGDTFVGLAYEECDNSGGSDGDKSVRVYTVGDFSPYSCIMTRVYAAFVLKKPGDWQRYRFRNGCSQTAHPVRS